MGTIQEFITKHGITIETTRVPENPDCRPDPREAQLVKWYKEAGHFHCILRRNSDPNYHPSDQSVLPSIASYYSMGSGHMVPLKSGSRPGNHSVYKQGKWWYFPAPKAESVLDCLASDACGYENARDFEDWCVEYGFDPDSRRAERIYRGIAEASKQLRQFLGNEAFQELLYETERL